MNSKDFERLTKVESVKGVFYDPQDGSVRLQYLSGGITYEISFPLGEALKMEEYFMMVRRGIADSQQDPS